MTGAQLSRIGQALYGERFKALLADALGVELRSVQYWCAGTRNMPPGAIRDLRRLVRARRTLLAEANAEIEEFLNNAG